MIVTIITTLAPVFGIILLGFIIARKNVMPMTTATGLNQFVYWIAMPAMMFDILVHLDAGGFPDLLIPALAAALFCNWLLSAVLSIRVFRASKAEAVILGCLANFPNGVFMGIAVVSFLLPGNNPALQVAGLCAFLYSMVIPVSDTILEMLGHKGESLPRLAASLGKTVIRNPMIMAGALGIVLGLTGIAVPVWAGNMASMLGRTAAPCALFAMGMVMNVQLAAMGASPSSARGRQAATHLLKLASMPCLTFLVLSLAGIHGIPLGVATLQAAMPAGVVTYVIAEKHRTCVGESSIVIFVNTVASVATIPVVISLLFARGVFAL